jgi:hypothetical protein
MPFPLFLCRRITLRVVRRDLRVMLLLLHERVFRFRLTHRFLGNKIFPTFRRLRLDARLVNPSTGFL